MLSRRQQKNKNKTVNLLHRCEQNWNLELTFETKIHPYKFNGISTKF